MKRLLEYSLAWILLVILGCIVVHAPLAVYVGTQWPALIDVVKAWKEMLMIVATGLLIIEITRLGKWGLFTSDKLFLVVTSYVGIHLVALLWTVSGVVAIMAGLAIDLRYILYLCLVYGFLRMYPDYRQLFVRVSVIGATIVVGFACLQIALPKDVLKYIGYGESTIMPYMTVDKNPDYVRLNSTLRGPNPLGAYAVIVLAGVLAYRVQFRRSIKKISIYLGLGVGSAVALWMSYSRSAVAAAIVTVGIVIAVRYRKLIKIRGSHIWKTLAVGTLVVACIALAARDTAFVQNVVLHDNPVTGEIVDSNTGHLASITDGTARLASQPLGTGIGSTGSASLYTPEPLIIENQYLMIAHEVGWVGLALFMTLFITLLRRLWDERSDWLALGVFASGIGLALIGIVLPVWVDDTVSIVWWGLVGIVIAKGATNGTTTNKKTT